MHQRWLLPSNDVADNFVLAFLLTLVVKQMEKSPFYRYGHGAFHVCYYSFISFDCLYLIALVTVSDAVETVSGSRGEEPKKKKPRLLGGVDLNSEEVQRLLKAKSSHKGALSEVSTI